MIVKYFFLLICLCGGITSTFAQSSVKSTKAKEIAFRDDYQKHFEILTAISENYQDSNEQVRESLINFLHSVSHGAKYPELPEPDWSYPLADCYVGAYIRKAKTWNSFCARIKYLLNLATLQTAQQGTTRTKGLYIYLALSRPTSYNSQFYKDEHFRKMIDTLGFTIGRLWLHPVLDTAECYKMPIWAFITPFKASWEHARLGEQLGKKHYLYTAKFYEKILNRKIVYDIPYTTKAHYNSSWMYLQINRLKDSCRMAKTMPVHPGMETAPKQLIAWNEARYKKYLKKQNKTRKEIPSDTKLAKPKQATPNTTSPPTQRQTINKPQKSKMAKPAKPTSYKPVKRAKPAKPNVTKY